MVDSAYMSHYVAFKDGRVGVARVGPESVDFSALDMDFFHDIFILGIYCYDCFEGGARYSGGG